ncbi:182 kDa tankyrase-1-binding protein isoform X2 [Pimephales promelas]|uniref:182 kDa tankyrase-1-binding protein isoform X2 n=1 Tax=Pimephales promelas TaxID=90988 RepID=UPI0019554E31|nr:182 kDa tankyrase-1-binding protein isoform X2 [Pimephales promelas]
MAAWVEATTREMGQPLINPDKPSVSVPGDTEKPALNPKPLLTAKPFSLQRNATVRSIRAPKTNFTRPLHRAASSETFLNTTDTLETSDLNGSDRSAAHKPVPLSPKPDLQAKPKPEPTKSTNDQTGPNSKLDVPTEDIKNVQPRSRAKSLGSRENQKKEQGSDPDVKVPSRLWPARNRLSADLTSKFQSPPQPDTVGRETEKEEPPLSPSAVSESPVENEEAGCSIKRRISLLFDRSAVSQINKRDVTPAEISIDIKQRIQNLSLPSTGAPKSPPYEKTNERSSERETEKVPVDKPPNTENAEEEEDDEEDEENYVAVPVYQRVRMSIDAEKKLKEEEEKQRKDQQLEKERQKQEEMGRLLEEERKAKEIERQQEEERKQQEEKQKQMDERRKQEEEWKRKIEEERKEEERRRQAEKEKERQQEQERLEREKQVEEEKRRTEEEEERQREEERLRQEKLKKERELEEERQRVQEMERQKEEEKLRKEREMERIRKEKEMEEERLKEEERLRQEREKERLKKEKEMEEERRRINEMERQKEEERLRKEREMERIRKEKEMEEERLKEEERLRQEREKERLKKEKEMEEERLKEEERLRQEREKERLKKEKEMEEERRRVQEMERQKEEERLRKEQEMERIRKEKEMEEERRRIQEMERQKEEERMRKEREMERIKKAKEMEEERRRVQEMERQKEEERLRKEREMERIKKEKEMEEERLKEEEKLRQEREKERLKKEKEMDEERRRLQEMERQKEEERLRKEREMERVKKEKEMEEERQRAQEMERQKEEERLRLEKEERLKKEREMEEERQRLQEMERQKEEEKLRKEREMERIQKEREIEERKRMEEERLRQEREREKERLKKEEEKLRQERENEEMERSRSPEIRPEEVLDASQTLVSSASPQLHEVLYDDFSVKPRRWGTGARRSSTPSPSREPEQNLQPEPTSNDPGSQEPCGERGSVEELMGSEPENCEHTPPVSELDTQADEGQLKDCEPEEDGVAEPDTENLIGETDEQSENNDDVDGLGTESRISHALQRLTRVRQRNRSTDSDRADVPDEEESRVLPVLESAAPLLDSSVLRSKVDLAKKRSIKRSMPTRAVRQRGALPALTEGTNPDWRFCDSTDAKDQCSNGRDSESEEEPSRDAVPTPAPCQPKRVPMFPGMNPSALMAQLKRRSGVVEAESPTEAQTPPSVPARSPRTPTMALGPRVLPPVDAKDNASGSSPSWLLELKSKKKMNQPDSEA